MKPDNPQIYAARIEFEKWIQSPPFEHITERWPDDDDSKHMWPGNYKFYHVQLSWCAWLAAKGIEE